MQHSGSIRYYANRQTLRYDLMPPDALDRAVRFLMRRNLRPYAVVEEWEEREFTARFRASCRGDLSWPPVREWRQAVMVRLYDLSQAPCAERRERRQEGAAAGDAPAVTRSRGMVSPRGG
jgi:hypothetical protein